ncbi:MAG: HlyD family efflux transporter periplasmic adaptor subunit [Lachnospiraceae bacterium]|nr:HlyD family efflux transporter periplasmic adaptor subunit [Lachnospiraceae bacterium]
MEKRSRKRNKKKSRWLTGIFICVVLLLAGAVAVRRRAKPAGAPAEENRTAQVTRQSITSELSSSGTLAAKDTYTITSLVEGEVIAADFEEGDQVEKGQILYQLDPSSIDSELNTASNSVSRAESSYNSAAEDYAEVQSKWSGNTYKATETGYIKNLYVEAGDKINNGSQIADIYSDALMKLRLPFLREEAALIPVGSQAVITLSGTGEQLPGVVTIVSSMDETLSGGRLVRYVTITVANPGGMTGDMTATAVVGGFSCSEEGSFTVSVDKTMSASISGNSSVEIAGLLVNEGDYVTEGQPVFTITEKSAKDLLESYKNSLEQAEEGLESARNKLESTQDNLENYTITAPISGQVIQKAAKVGDNISRSGNTDTAMAVIYDLSSLTFEMSIDELDIQKVEVGQTVEVTADAFEGETFTGKVTNVSLQSSYSNGVTNYPVTVTLDEAGKLLPGMNVDGTIIIDKAENVLTIPVDSLMRGSRVYVKDDTALSADKGVPAGFRAVEVTTGLTNDQYVEILEGLSEGDEVYINQSSQNTEIFGNMQGFQPGGPGMGGPGMGNSGGGGGNDRRR